MGYAIYHSGEHKRFQGYSVSAVCDHPNCENEIDRGMGYVCCEDQEKDNSCGHFFCSEHIENYIYYDELEGMSKRQIRALGEDPDDLPEEDDDPIYKCCHKVQAHKESVEWLEHILADDTWNEWREKNKPLVEQYKRLLKRNAGKKKFVVVKPSEK